MIRNPDVFAIMVQTTGGKKVFRFYGVPADKPIPSPLNQSNNKPVFTIERCTLTGKYHFNDAATGKRGDVIDFVMAKYSLNFRNAVSKIIKDLKIIQ